MEGSGQDPTQVAGVAHLCRLEPVCGDAEAQLGVWGDPPPRPGTIASRHCRPRTLPSAGCRGGPPSLTVTAGGGCDGAFSEAKAPRRAEEKGLWAGPGGGLVCAAAGAEGSCGGSEGSLLPLLLGPRSQITALVAVIACSGRVQKLSPVIAGLFLGVWLGCRLQQGPALLQGDCLLPLFAWR